MTNPDEYYAANTLPPLDMALDLYFKTGAPYKDTGVKELIFPAGEHKELMSKKGDHEFAIWISKGKVYTRARCTFDKKCEFNSERVWGRNREAVKQLPWDKIDSTKYFRFFAPWLLKYNFEFKTLIRALVTVCDRKVEIPLTTRWGKTFQKFNEYREHRWPEEAVPSDKPRFIEEVFVRVAFWFQTAADVGALK